MALVPIQFQAGIYKESAELAAGRRGRWSDGNLVRFYKGQPQTIGGWTTVSNSNSVVGVVRSVLPWVGNDNTKNLAVGSHLRLYIWRNNTFFNVTPLRDSGTLGSNPFTTTASSAVVTVNDTSHGVSVNDFVIFSGATAVGGITIDGEYQVTSFVDSDNYTITHSSAASSSATGGGASVTYEYEIPVGSSEGFFGGGWGSGSWGMGTWGTPRTGNIFFAARTWALDTAGEDLFANPRGGGIYTWDLSVGTATRAAVVSNAPTTSEFLIVSPQARHLISLGADGDRMLIKWASSNDFTDWTPTAQNTAGDYRLDDGSRIISAIRTTQNAILIFTDTAVYTLAYVGPPFVFRISQIAANIGIAGPNACGSFGNVVWWMTTENFFVYDGTVRVLPSDVRDFVIESLEIDQRAKIYCSVNREWDEIWWFYQDTSASENNRYVAYNFVDQNWHIGALERTAFADVSEAFREIVALDSSGNMFSHERTDVSPDGAYLEGDFDYDNGENFVFSNRFIPEFDYNSGTVNLTMTSKRYPSSTTTVSKGPFAMTSTTEKVDFRIRGRQLGIRLDSDGTRWRLSSGRLRVVASGKQ